MTLRPVHHVKSPLPRRLAAALVAGAILVAGAAAANVISLSPLKDNTIFEPAIANLSNGAGEHLFAGVNNLSERRRALLAFDVAANIQTGSRINSVMLRLNMSKTGAPMTAMSLHRVTTNWGEGASNAADEEGMGAAATNGDATWVHSIYNTTPWSAQGGDFASTVSAALIVGGVGVYTFGSTPQMILDVQAWVDTPASNFGWILLGFEGAIHTAKRFDSRENPTAVNRPALVIDYTPDIIPTLKKSWGEIKASYR